MRWKGMFLFETKKLTNERRRRCTRRRGIEEGENVKSTQMFVFENVCYLSYRFLHEALVEEHLFSSRRRRLLPTRRALRFQMCTEEVFAVGDLLD